MDSETIKCVRCEEEKYPEQFPDSKRKSNGKQSWCKSCYSEYNSSRYSENWETNYFKRLWKVYGLTKNAFNELLDACGGLCQCCGVEMKRGVPANKHHDALCIDHDHKTGDVRGLLCRNCNMALGNIGHDPQVARRMADYLEK